MQLVLANGKPSHSEKLWTNISLSVFENHILHQLGKQCNLYQTRMSGEDSARNKLISELWNDVGSIEVRCFLNHGPDAPPKINVVLFSCEKSILGNLVRKFQENVTISLSLHFSRNSTPGSMAEHANPMDDESCTLQGQGMKIDPKTFTCVGMLTNSADYATIFSGESTINGLEIVVDIPTGPILKGAVSAAEKILEKGAHSDLIILTGSGTEVKAHKSFLSVCSPALEAMCGMEESKTGRVDMSDLSEDGVEAFLRFVYFEDLEVVKDNIQVAFELFYAGHKYGVSKLETEMRSLLVKTKNEDIAVDLAFKMYMFTRNIDTAAELKTKSLQIMKTKLDELELLEEYNELFEKPSHSKTAKALCRDLAKTSSE